MGAGEEKRGPVARRAKAGRGRDEEAGPDGGNGGQREGGGKSENEPWKDKLKLEG